jgi:transposase
MPIVFDKYQTIPLSCPAMADEFIQKLINLGLSEEDIANTPPAVLAVLKIQMLKVEQLEKRVAELEQKLGMNSSNSSKPPSSDPPYNKQQRRKKRKQAKKATSKGHRQQMLEPTEEHNILPGPCSCGCCDYEQLEQFYTHQQIEIPEIPIEVRHFNLIKGRCSSCGRKRKATVPAGHQAGFGPRLSALIGELAGIEGNSRTMIQRFCSSVLGIPISAGGIQKVLNRVSSALEPYYEQVRKVVHGSKVNHVDETPWFLNGDLHWLWTLGNKNAALFMIHENRSRMAFEQLIGDWEGLLVSDGYGLYRNWVGDRQTCLSHLIRRAKGLSEHPNQEIALCGTRAFNELKRLNAFAKAPPTTGQWRAFYARFCGLIRRYRDRKDDAGKLVRHLENQMVSLWTFLHEAGVDSTNNLAERLLRFGVLWRKRSQGSRTEKGLRFVERVLTVKQTTTIQKKSSFALLVEAVSAFFLGRTPDLSLLGLSPQTATP